MRYRGTELGASEVGVMAPFSTDWHSVSGSSQTASMSLTQSDLARLGPVLAGQDIVVSRGALSVAVAPPTMARLRRLRGAAVHLARAAPEIIANPDAARGLEASLTEGFVDCLTAGRVRTETAGQWRHRAIMRRFRDHAEEHPDEPIYLTELCEALSVPRRTLNLCCQEQLGVSPRAVQRCRIAFTEAVLPHMWGEVRRLIQGGFPSRQMSDPWGGNGVGGCRGCVFAVAGRAGGRP